MEPTGELNAAGWRYDCYMAHTWGLNNKTHDKVMMIVSLLKQRNIRTWVDDENLKSYVSIDITEGLRNSACILVFITELYLQKVENADTNASKEFGQAVKKGSQYLLPVVLDPKCLDPTSWVGSKVGFHIAGQRYYDFSSGESLYANINPLCERIRYMSSAPRLRTSFASNIGDDLASSLNSTGENVADLKPGTPVDNSQNLEIITSMIQHQTKVNYGRIKLMFVGRSGAGKTSSIKSLLGYSFDEEEPSTELADVGTDVDVKLKDISVLEWVETIGPNHVLEKEFKKYTKGLMKMGAERRQAVEEAMAQRVVEDAPEVFNTEAMFTELKENLDEVLIREEEDNQVIEESLEDVLQFSVWDFGGQAVFHSLHNLYLTKGGIYIVVFSASDMIDNQTKEKEFNSLKQWLEAINLNAPGSPVVIVGTKSGDLTEEELNSIDSELEEMLDEVEVVVIEAESLNLAFFPVENSTSQQDPKPIDELKTAIMRLVSTPEEFDVSNTAWNRMIPLSWMYFMKCILKKFNDRVSVEEFLEEGTEVGFEPEELIRLVEFYHEVGAILAFFSNDQKQLEKVVVLHPQWLLKAISTFIFDPEKHGKNALKRAGRKWKKQMRLYRKFGVLSKSMVEHLLSTQNIIDRETTGFIMNQCEKLLLISRFPFGTNASTAREEDLSETRWLVPCMNQKHDNLSSRAPSQKCYNIFIKWDGILPRGIFERLICLFLQRNGAIEGSKPPVVNQKHACFFFRNVPVFLTDLTPEASQFLLNVQEYGYGVHVPKVLEILKHILEDLQKDFVGKYFKYEILLESLHNEDAEGNKYQCELNTLVQAKSERREFVPLSGSYEAVPVACFSDFIQSAPTPVQDEPKAEGAWKWDCFLAHEWGVDQVTHRKVLEIADLLRKAGLRVWVDNSYIEDYMSNEMADGILNSACIVTFLTKRYFQRCQNPNTNCAMEVNHARSKGVKHIVPVVLDHTVLNTEEWVGSVVGHVLAGKLYINFSNEKEQTQNFPELCKQIEARQTFERKPVLIDALDE